MKSKLSAALVAAGWLFVSSAPASALTYSFNFSADAGLVTGSGTLDVSGGNATAGTGVLFSPFWSGSQTITLVTLSTPGVHDLGGGNLSYRFGGGTDLIGDTAFPIDGNGLVFLVGGPGNTGLNIWSNGPTSPYTVFLASDTLYNGYNDGVFTASAAAVPAPIVGAGLPGVLLANGGLPGTTSTGFRLLPGGAKFRLRFVVAAVPWVAGDAWYDRGYRPLPEQFRRRAHPICRALGRRRM